MAGRFSLLCGAFLPTLSAGLDLLLATYVIQMYTSEEVRSQLPIIEHGTLDEGSGGERLAIDLSRMNFHM